MLVTYKLIERQILLNGTVICKPHRPHVFATLLVLALKRTNPTTEHEEVTHDEIRARVRAWRKLKADTLGETMARWISTTRLNDVVVCRPGSLTLGPYSLKPRRSEIEFDPDDRARAIAAVSVGAAVGSRRMPWGELAAYQSLARRGIYTPDVIERILERLGEAKAHRSLDDRLTVLQIQATIAQNQRRLADARILIRQGLRLAERNQRPAAAAAFQTEAGWVEYLELNPASAERWFLDAIASVTSQGDGPAQHGQIADLWRCIAKARIKRGDVEAAKTAIKTSRELATSARSDEVLRLLTQLERANAFDVSPVGRGSTSVAAVPADDALQIVIARTADAKRLLHDEPRVAVEHLRWNLTDAVRLGFVHEVDKILDIAREHSVNELLPR